MSFTTSQELPDDLNEESISGPPPDIAEILNEVAAGIVDPGRIARLTDPSREQFEQFLVIWETLDLETKRTFLRELVRQSETNLEINFHRYFHATLDDEDSENRALGIKGLWEDTSTSLLERLCVMARSETDPAVQEAVAIGLGQFNLLAEYEELDEASAMITSESLHYLYHRGASRMVRRRALESLAFYSGDDSIVELIEQWYASSFEQDRAGALVAMGRNLHTRWLPMVLESLTDEEPEVRAEAAWAAGQFLQEEAIEPLARMIDDDDEEIPEIAIVSIGQIGGQRAIDSLRYIRTQVSSPSLETITDEALEEAQVWLDLPDFR